MRTIKMGAQGLYRSIAVFIGLNINSLNLNSLNLNSSLNSTVSTNTISGEKDAFCLHVLGSTTSQYNTLEIERGRRAMRGGAACMLSLNLVALFFPLDCVSVIVFLIDCPTRHHEIFNVCEGAIAPTKKEQERATQATAR